MHTVWSYSSGMFVENDAKIGDECITDLGLKEKDRILPGI